MSLDLVNSASAQNGAAMDDALPNDWRDQLAARLGMRPRRIGPWAELALYGARQCLDANGVDVLSPHAVLRVASAFGPVEALAQVGATCEDGLLPMPFDFLQSQPSQMLAALGAQLQWRGDACFVAQDKWEPLLDWGQTEANVLRRHAAQSRRPWAGLLLGCVDLVPSPVSRWRWIV